MRYEGEWDIFKIYHSDLLCLQVLGADERLPFGNITMWSSFCDMILYVESFLFKLERWTTISKENEVTHAFAQCIYSFLTWLVYNSTNYQKLIFKTKKYYAA